MSDRRDESTHGLTPEDGQRVGRYSAISPGSLFAGRYRLVESIGVGASGEVFRARDEMAGADVALKLLYAGAAAMDVDRFRRELRLVRGLQHPGILRVHDMAFSEGWFYTVAELLDGEDLRRRLQRTGALPPEEAEKIIRGVLEALAAAHEGGVIHRDIKPSNIFLARRPGAVHERVVLLDFGLAREASGDALTVDGRFLGTPAYASPEQVRGEAVGPASDLYSCGIVLWEMLAGAPPFDDSSDLAVLNAQVGARPPSPRKHLHGAPPRLRHVAMRLLEKSPSARPASARSALASLDHPAGLTRRVLLAARRAAQHPLLRRSAALGTGLALVVIASALFALSPVDTVIDGSRIAWLTRIGATITVGDVQRPVAAAALDSGGFGPFRGTWVAFQASPAPAPAQRQVAVQYLPAPFESGRHVLWDDPLFNFRVSYTTDLRPFQPRRFYPLSGARSPNEAVAVLYLVQWPFFPSALDVILPDGTSGTFLHPGHMIHVTSFRRPGGESLQIAALGVNNLLGHRPVVLSFPATVQAAGQAPPFTAPLSRIPPAPGGWYLLLPYRLFDAQATLTIEGDRGRAEFAHGLSVEFDAATGAPVDPAQRAGLGAPEWIRSRDALYSALGAAAVHEQTERPALGAALLEAYARPAQTPPVFRSCAWLRAAQLRAASAASAGEEAYRLGLADVVEARRIEPDVPRARLLEAELLARLGQRDAVAQRLQEWGGSAEQAMFQYEWLLADWLAGMPLPYERIASFWPAVRRDTDVWEILVVMTAACLRGDPAAALARFDAHGQDADLWDVHFYWAARAALDQATPDPMRALALLDRAASAPRAGEALPIAALRLRATRLRGRGPAPKRLEEDAAAELARLARTARVDLQSEVLLPLARADVGLAAPRDVHRAQRGP